MATTGRGGNPRCPNVFGRVKGSWRSVQPFGTSSSRAGDRERPKPEVYSAAGDVSPQAGDWEGPVSAHPLLGPRRWSPGRAGPKAKGTYPVACRRGLGQPPGSRATAAVELERPSPRAPRWAPDIRKHRGKKEPPLRTVDEGLYWAVTLEQNSWGRVSEETKGVFEV